MPGAGACPPQIAESCAAGLFLVGGGVTLGPVCLAGESGDVMGVMAALQVIDAPPHLKEAIILTVATAHIGDMG